MGIPDDKEVMSKLMGDMMSSPMVQTMMAGVTNNSSTNNNLLEEILEQLKQINAKLDKRCDC